MSIKFIDELTPGTSYAVFDRETDQFTEASGKITGTISKTLRFVEDKTTTSPYVYTSIKRRFVFEDRDGNPVSLKKTHDLIFVEATMLPPTPTPTVAPLTPPSSPVIAPLRRQRRGVDRS